MKEITQWVTKHKSEIIVGVVVFVITSFLTNIGKWITSVTPTAGQSFLVFIQNQIYYTAAQQSIPALVSEVLILVLAFPSAMAWIIIEKSRATLQKRRIINKFKKTLEAFTNSKDGSTEEKDTFEQLKAIIDKMKNGENQKKNRTHPVLIDVFNLLLCLVFLIYTVLFIIVPTQLWNRYELSVTQITPYVGEKEIAMVRSKWVSMKTKDDYNDIVLFIDGVKKENHLED